VLFRSEGERSFTSSQMATDLSSCYRRSPRFGLKRPVPAINIENPPEPRSQIDADRLRRPHPRARPLTRPSTSFDSSPRPSPPPWTRWTSPHSTSLGHLRRTGKSRSSTGCHPRPSLSTSGTAPPSLNWGGAVRILTRVNSIGHFFCGERPFSRSRVPAINFQLVGQKDTHVSICDCHVATSIPHKLGKRK
jgi:hypothetical protein